jgi:hypothetical protein
MLVVGAWVLSRVLKFSLWVTLLVGCAPFVLPYLELPFSRTFTDANPLYLIGGGWALMVCLALGRKAVVPTIGEATRSPGGMARAAYVVVLGVSLLVVALLVSRPELVERAAPGWKGTAGLVLLCASLLSMSLSLARFLRAALGFTVWAFVSLVLASELFLNKLPQEVVRDDLRQFEPLMARLGVAEALEHVDALVPTAATTESALRAVVLGGSPNTGFPLSPSASLAKQLESLMKKTGANIDVTDASSLGATVYQIRHSVEKIAPTKPNLVVIVGWTPDSERGINSYGIPGLSEKEAEAKVQASEQLRKFPFVADVLESVLYRYVSKLFQPEVVHTPPSEIPARVSVTEYGDELAAAVKTLRDAGAQVVLLPEPSIAPGEEVYRAQMVKVASNQSASFLPIDEMFQTDLNRATGFARGRLLSESGYAVIANAVARVVAPLNGSKVAEGLTEEASPVSASLLQPTVDGTSTDYVKVLVRPADVTGDIIFRIKMLEQGSRYYRVVFSVNGEYVADRRLDSRDETRVRFKLPQSARAFSVVELGLRTLPSPPSDADLIGTTGQFVPVPIEISAQRDGVSMVKVGRVARFAQSQQENPLPVNIAISLDPRSGDIVSSMRSADVAELNRWIVGQPWGSVVATTLLGDGASLASARAGLKFIGIDADPSSSAQSRAVVGIAGIKTGAGILKASKETPSVTLSLGSDILKSYAQFQMLELTLNERSLPSGQRVGREGARTADSSAVASTAASLESGSPLPTE